MMKIFTLYHALFVFFEMRHIIYIYIGFRVLGFIGVWEIVLTSFISIRSPAASDDDDDADADVILFTDHPLLPPGEQATLLPVHVYSSEQSRASHAHLLQNLRTGQ